jgi:hypothetical protein
MGDPIAFLERTYADIMHFNQALKKTDNDKFVKAIVQEVNDHIDFNH